MANRHLARSVALQSLYEWDFNEFPPEKIDSIIVRNLKEFASGIADGSFAHRLAKNILEKKGEIDVIIERAAPEWPLSQISVVDRNVLRMGLYELLFVDRSEVPAKVAINEAIELAKAFGGETSSKFVNGVLGTVYKEIGEPGKEETSETGRSRKTKHLITDPKLMPIERLGGAIVFARNDGDIFVALVHDIFGYWTLPKGRIEEGESVEVGTKREVMEEISIDCIIEDKIGENEYVAADPVRGKIRKMVTYFVAKSEFVPVKLKESGGLNDAKWFSVGELADLSMYDDIRPIIAKAIKKFAEKI